MTALTETSRTDGLVRTPRHQPARDAEALRLRELQCSYRSIVDQMGYANPGSAYRAVQRALLLQANEPKAQRRVILSASLEQEGRRLLDLISDEQTPVDQVIRAAVVYVRVSERLAKLWGLDEPQQHQVLVHVISDEVIDEEVARIDAELTERGVDLGLLSAAGEIAARLSGSSSA